MKTPTLPSDPLGEALQDWQLGESVIQIRFQQPRLLVRPDANGNLNRQDYLMQVAEANSLNGIPDLCGVLKTNFETLVSLSPGDLNSFFHGAPLTKLISEGARRHHANSLIKHGLPFKARVCPLCIGADINQDRNFNLSLPVPCSVHQTMPVDFCSNCHGNLSYRRRNVNRCDCGFQLARCEALPTPRWLKLFYGVFAPWHLNVSSLQTFVETAKLDSQAARLVRLLLGPLPRSTERPPVPACYVVSTDFPAIERLMEQWPDGLASALATASASRQLDNYRRRFLKHPSPLLLDAFRDWSREFRNKRMATRRPEPDELGSAPAQRIRLLAKLDADATQKLRASDLHSAGWTLEIGGGKTYWQDGVTIKSLKTFFTNTVSIDEATRVLGCAPSQLRQLVKLHCIEAEQLSAKPRSPRFKPEALDRWLYSRRARALPLSHAKDAVIALSDIPAVGSNGCVLVSWGKLMRAVLDDNIAIYSAGGMADMSNLYVAKTVLQQLGIAGRRHGPQPEPSRGG